MARYFFDIKNGHRLIDPAGLDCRDDEDAIAKARAIAAAIGQETPEGRRKISVLTEDRQEIEIIPVHPNLAAE